MSRTINIVFDPENGKLVFVDTEDSVSGQSVSVGKWIEMSDGLFALQVRIMDASHSDGLFRPDHNPEVYDQAAELEVHAELFHATKPLVSEPHATLPLAATDSPPLMVDPKGPPLVDRRSKP